MIKDFWKRLRQWVSSWEHSPFTYEFKDEEVHHCLNCHNDFKGNYCPYCSQPADTKRRITWGTILKNFLEVWDFSTRSVPSTLWQLSYRPGYLIRDYLQGRRLTSYAPIKMLLVVAFILTIIDYYVVGDREEREAKTELSEKKVEAREESSLPPQILPMTGVEATAEDTLLAEAARQRQAEEESELKEVVFQETLEAYFNRFDDWSKENKGWSMLMYCSFMILPTWLLFRRSKSFPKHSLPEGFYIQVFMCQLMLIITEISELVPGFILMASVYYVYAYRQLFGYSTWGTVWRLAISFLLTVFLVIFVVLFVISAIMTWKGV